MESSEIKAVIIDSLLYTDSDTVVYDVYYNFDGHPKQVHDAFGGSECCKFRTALLGEISRRNSTAQAIQISGYGYAVPHNKNNCEGFELNYQGIMQTICKMTIEIKAK